ncbi:hypothetical protein [Dyella kyungheensis]|uniref:Uncharacterized protein n=1 Tax=Dyella kyungheensis TaxID=1242174 RepID=A0ABS2JXB9_9GAMM|nr:hypothetical protein [Dyella kyungheensis]MBM7123667.1 hypothetical protein [Dyella kyungheensis]
MTKGTPLNVRPTTAAELRITLKELARWPLTDGGDYVHVQRACLLLSMYLKDSAPASVGKLMPEIVWHYLSDVDIRHKDPAYAVAQTDALLFALVAWEAEKLG